MLVIGYDKMQQLHVESAMRFTYDIKINGDNGPKVFGLDIIMKPEIDGLFLI